MAADLPADAEVVVVGTHARSASCTLHELDTDVVTVRPPGG